MTAARRISIFVDADACPVKQEIYRVAERQGCHVFVVSNSRIMVPRYPFIEPVVVPSGRTSPTTGLPSVPRRATSWSRPTSPWRAAASRQGPVSSRRTVKRFQKARSAWPWRPATSWISCAEPERSPEARNPSRRETARNFWDLWIEPSTGSNGRLGDEPSS